jgi:hypothetical protein
MSADRKKTNLKSVTRAEPCVICGGAHKCSRGDDGLIICGRPPEVTRAGFVFLGPCKGDEQFALYRLQDQGPTERNGKSPSARNPVDWSTKSKEFQKHLTPSARRELASTLNLPESALSYLPIGYSENDPHGPCWTFPEVDASGKVTGINRR